MSSLPPPEATGEALVDKQAVQPNGEALPVEKIRKKKAKKRKRQHVPLSLPESTPVTLGEWLAIIMPLHLELFSASEWWKLPKSTAPVHAPHLTSGLKRDAELASTYCFHACLSTIRAHPAIFKKHVVIGDRSLNDILDTAGTTPTAVTSRLYMQRLLHSLPAALSMTRRRPVLVALPTKLGAGFGGKWFMFVYDGLTAAERQEAPVMLLVGGLDYYHGCIIVSEAKRTNLRKARCDERFMRGLYTCGRPASKQIKTQAWFNRVTNAQLNLLHSWSCCLQKKKFANGDSGWDLIACHSFRPGSLVTEYGGELVSLAKATAADVQSHHCSLRDGTGRVMVGHTDPALACMRPSGAEFGSFVNCWDPAIVEDKLRVNCNITVTTFNTGADPRVFIVAIRTIAEGESLVLDYGARAAKIHHGL